MSRSANTVLIAGMLIPLLVFPVAASGQEVEHPSVSAIYDTVAVRGEVGETNPLFVYENIGYRPQLIDSTTVLFSDSRASRLIHANLVTGDGWEAGGPGDGPGEFSGRGFFFTESGGHIYAALADWRWMIFTRSGELLQTGRYPHPFGGNGQSPRGMLGSGEVISLYRQRQGPDRDERALAQSIEAYSRDSGLLWSHPLPAFRSNPAPGQRPTEEQFEAVRTQSLNVHARHSTVVWTRPLDSAVVVLDGDGSIRGQINLQHEPIRAFVDADERIWVATEMKDRERGVYKVFGRDLDLIMDVHEGPVMDAWGAYLLTISADETGVQLLNLLRRRIPPPRGS